MVTAGGLFGQKPPAKNGGRVVDVSALIEKAKPAAAGLNHFGLKLLEAEAASKPNTNVFISTLSLYLALAMTEGGAEGKTRMAMRQALEVPAGMSDETMHDAASALMQSLQTQKGVELSIANAVWSSPKLPLSAKFVERSKTLYDAEAKSIDFAQPGAAEIINRWVSDKTKAKIPEIVTEDAVRSAIAILTNAIYFMGRWKDEFGEPDTADADFTLAGGRTKKVRMMSQGRLKSAYRQGDGYEAAALSYKASGIEMFAILPAAGVSPEQALAKASPDKLINGYQPFDVDLKLPKFTLDYKTGLKDTLTKMGMGIAFQFPGAEFAPMGSPLFYISEVLHKTRLEVDEKGTVAAAATAVVMMVGSAMPMKQQTKVLVFNRPFAVVIADSYTGAALFEGVVYEP